MTAVMPTEDWQDHRTCTTGPYPETMWKSRVIPARPLAQHACSHCPVINECRAAVEAEPLWGGGVAAGVAYTRSGVPRGTGQSPADHCDLCPDRPAGLRPATRRPHCGTRYGYNLHRDANEDACQPCLAAKRAYGRKWARAKRRSWRAS